MKEEKIIRDATWSGDEKSVDLTLFDNTSKKSKRITIEVGTDVWEEETIEYARNIIINELSEYIIVNKEFSII